MKNFNCYFLKFNTGLSELESDMRKILDAVGERMVSITEAVKTEVIIEHSPENCIPELGIGGQYTKADSRINIYLDLTNSHLNENLEQEIGRTFAHEYMHALREQYVSWENGTFLDALIAEGLTQSFEVEVQSHLPPSAYATALTASELDDAWIKAKDILNQQEYSDDWFFGGNGIKKWTGYSLGYKLVQNKIKETGLKASQLYKLPSTDFLLQSN